MNRAAGRWLTLGVLGAIVIGLGIATSVSDRKLVDGLMQGDPESFETFAERQDAYIFLQSEPAATRATVAGRLGHWSGDSAAKLAVLLIPDPDPAVRAALVESLARIAERKPSAVAAEFGHVGAAESAALVEAAAKDAAVGKRILDEVFEKSPATPNAYLLAKRVGSLSKPALIRSLESKDDAVALAAADALASLALDETHEADVAETLLTKYRGSESQEFKDRLLPILAQFAPEGGRSIFAATAADHTAPSELRAAAAAALVKLGDPAATRLRSDADTAVALAAAGR